MKLTFEGEKREDKIVPVNREGCRARIVKLNAEEKDDGKALTMIKYSHKFGEKSKDKSIEPELFIYMPGMRLENYRKDGKGNGTEGFGASNLIKLLAEREQSTRLVTILNDNNMPLEKQSQEIADIINTYLAKHPNCPKVNILGISKCGCISVSMLKYIKQEYRSLCDVVAYSTPYKGTIFATEEVLEERLRDFIQSLIKTKNIAKLKEYLNILKGVKRINNGQEIEMPDLDEITDAEILVRKIMETYNSVMSNSHMDNDIRIPGRQKENLLDKNNYDPLFLENMFNEETVNAIGQVGKFTNITAIADKGTLIYGTRKFNGTALALYFSSKFLFRKEKSDGIVELSSATAIENIPELKGKIKKRRIHGANHDCARCIEIMEILVDSFERVKNNQQER